MEWFRNMVSRMDRTPKAKRRFNLLKDETPVRPGRHKGHPSLASFIFAACIPLAGVWQIQSDIDPSLAPSRPSSRWVKACGATSPVLPGPSAAVCRVREDGRKPEAARVGLEKTVADKPANAVERRPRGQSGGELPPASSPRDVRPSGGHGERSEAIAPRHGPGHSRPPASRKAGVGDLLRKAQACQRRKNFETAIELYRRVLQEQPGHCDALFHLASIYLERGAYEEADPLLQDFVRRRPGDPHGLVNLAIAEIALGRPAEAVAHLDTALTLEDPPRFTIYLNKAVALSRLERLEEAVAWYRKAEALNPGHANLLFNMAVTFDRLGRYREALRRYAAFLESGESTAAPRERQEVEARISVLVAYLVEGSKALRASGGHRTAEQER